LSQDKFWEQWGSSSTQPAEKAAEPAKAPEAEKKDAAGGVDSDVLSAWLQALPPHDPLVPEVPQTPPPSPPGTAADLAALWPPSAPVDPFAGIQSSGSASDWDLAFDDDVVPAVKPIPETPEPAAAPSGAGEFAVDLGNLAGPAPVANPFNPELSTSGGVTPEAPAAPPPAPAISPFGPPPPPVAPPPEALEAVPLKLVITTGRRTQEQTIQGEALIGRPDATRGLHPEIDLRLDDAVSRRHAKIYVKNGQYVLTDLNSTNGTRHNHEWLQPEHEVVLKPGDEIEVGELTLIRVLEAPEANA
jgi:hypothetical protein